MNFQREKGYTLIEVIISVSIMIIMTGIVLGTYSLGRKPDTVEFETQKIASAIRSARNMMINSAAYFRLNKYCSLSIMTVCTVDTDCSAGEGRCVARHYPLGGYGVHIEEIDGQYVYTVFGQLDTGTTAPWYDSTGLDATDETVEFSSMPDYLTITDESGNTSMEINFSSNDLFLYNGSGGAWNLDNTDSYELNIEDKTLCSSIGKRGIITISRNTLMVEEVITDC